jgi:hypothetical protein
MGAAEVHKDLILRIAVREVEAWLLGDRHGIARFMGVAINLVPQNPEALPDPKAELIKVARHCRDRNLRDAIVPFGTAPIGHDYNAEIGRFVLESWDPGAAAHECQSLNRMMQKIEALASESWPVD